MEAMKPIIGVCRGSGSPPGIFFRLCLICILSFMSRWYGMAERGRVLLPELAPGSYWYAVPLRRQTASGDSHPAFVLPSVRVIAHENG